MLVFVSLGLLVLAVLLHLFPIGESGKEFSKFLAEGAVIVFFFGVIEVLVRALYFIF